MARVPANSDPTEGGHSVGTARRIDQLGRIVVPAELRKMTGISSGDLIDFRMIDGHISLLKVEPECALCNGTNDLSAVHVRHLCADCLDEIRQMPKCAICGATDDLVERNGKFVCDSCVREISLV
jgi:transcriptional pleiotropic regulator of transition state genes